MTEPFDPAAHPVLTMLTQQLRELAGETAYRAGRDYLRQGSVGDPVVSGTTARATVRGSTEYHVTIAFAVTAEAKVTCTCPAHRRKRHCKHVVAVCVALAEQPRLFQLVAPAEIPTVEPPRRRRRESNAKQQAEALKTQQRLAGLELVERVLNELAGSGIGGLGTEQLALLASATETVQGLKLRRLGNGLSALRRLVVERRDDERTPAEFADLLIDLSLTRQSIATALNGGSAIDPALAEELIGKTWRAADLEPVTGIRLIPVARLTQDDGDFHVESTWLVDVDSQEIFVERHITPRGLRGDRAPARRLTLEVEAAGLYPGASPRRIKLITVRHASLTDHEIARVVDRAVDDVEVVRRRLIERLAVPFEAPAVPVTFRPNRMVARGERIAALDTQERALPLIFPDSWSKPAVRGMVDADGQVAVVGSAVLGERGPELQCLALIGDLGWANGPTYPDLPAQ